MRPQPSPHRTIDLVGLGIVLSLLGDATLYTVLPDPTVAAAAGLSLSMVGVVLGLNRLVRLGLNPAAGVLFDRLPRRPLLLAAMALGALSTASYALAPGAGLLLFGRVMWGAAWSGLWIGGTSAVLDLAGEESRGRLSARLQMWFFVGGGVAFFAGGAFTDLLGYRPGLLASAGCTAVGLLLWLLWLPETRAADEPRPASTGMGGAVVAPLNLAVPPDEPYVAGAPAPELTDGAGAADTGVPELTDGAGAADTGVRDLAATSVTGVAAGSATPIPTRRSSSPWAFPWRQALPASVPIFALRLVFAGVMASTTILWLSALVGRRLEFGGLLLPLATLTGAFSSLRLGASVAGAPLGGWISDRLGRRWAVIAGCLLLGAAAVALMAESTGVAALLSALLASLAAGGAQALAPALAGDAMQPTQRSRGLGVIYSVGDLGSALGPPLALGWLPRLQISGVYLLSAAALLAVALHALAMTLGERRAAARLRPSKTPE
jgi:X-X-X-Leu-X-X-Gly heptad repeat protein